ncbi:Polymer-forming cytoskeletal [compost metagenome]
MKMKDLDAKDLRINGMGQVPGGTYGKVNTDGVATLKGEVVCSSLTANGSLKVKGSIHAGQFRLNGTGSGTGTLSGEQLRVDGTLKVDGNVSSRHVKINGMLQATGEAIGEQADIDGSMKLGGSAKYEAMKVHGLIQVDRRLSAGELDIVMAGACRAKEISGERIHVRKKMGSSRLLALLSTSLAPRLTAELIEGDEIVLEETTAGVIRGNIIRIGPGCEIDRVEYRLHYEIDPKASVGRVEQV